jgi:hypothetical protein
MAEGASSNDYRCGVMHRCGGRSLLQGVEPVRSSPLRGVRGVDGYHPQPLVGAHLDQPVAKLACRYAAHHAPHALTAPPASQSLASYSSSILEVEMLNRYDSTIVGMCDGDELADGGAKSSIASGRIQAAEFEGDRVRLTNRIASWIHNPTSKVSSIQINRHYARCR